MLQIFETLKSSPSGTLPPLRGHSILSKQFYQLGPRTQAYEPMGIIVIQITAHIFMHPVIKRKFLIWYTSLYIFWLYIVYLTFFFKFLFIFLWIFCLHWVCVPYACLVPTASHHVRAGNQTWVLWESSWCSEPRNHLQPLYTNYLTSVIAILQHMILSNWHWSFFFFFATWTDCFIVKTTVRGL